MNPTMRGKEGAQGPSSLTYRPGAGISVIRSFSGSEAYVMGIFNALSADVTAEVDGSQAPLFRLVIRTPDRDDYAAQVTTLWELLGNDVQEDIFGHPIALALSSDWIDTIHRAVDDKEEEAIDAIEAVGGAVQSIYNLAIRGQSFIASQYVLRRTMLVSSRYQTKMAYTGVDMLWTKEQLIATEGIPDTLLFSIAEIPNKTATDHLFRWLKKTPTVTQTVNGRFQLSQEWWLYLWNRFLYDEQP